MERWKEDIDAIARERVRALHGAREGRGERSLTASRSRIPTRLRSLRSAPCVTRARASAALRASLASGSVRCCGSQRARKALRAGAIEVFHSTMVPSWSRKLARPIVVKHGRPGELRTLADARDLIHSLPGRRRLQPAWQRAEELLLRAAGSR